MFNPSNKILTLIQSSGLGSSTTGHHNTTTGTGIGGTTGSGIGGTSSHDTYGSSTTHGTG